MPYEKGNLRLHEEVLLLVLREREGTPHDAATSIHAVGAALLGELIDAGRVALVPAGKKLFVELRDARPLGDPLLDECLGLVATARRRAQIDAWVSRFSARKRLLPRVAQGLVARGILRAEERTILLIFRRRVYPELDPRPEKAVRDRLRRAIFSEARDVDPRTVRLLSLADSVGLLPAVFGKKELKPRRQRVKALVAGEPLGAATRRVREAEAAAAVVATTAVT